MTQKEKIQKLINERKALDIYEEALNKAVIAIFDSTPAEEAIKLKAVADGMSLILEALGVAAWENIAAQANLYTCLKAHKIMAEENN